MGYALAIHGGAGLIRKTSLTETREKACRIGLETALAAGQDVLSKGGTAMDAAVAAVVVMENDPHFNAGRGSVYAADGQHEFDAAVMCGESHGAGAVSGIRTVKNPILLARAVMDRTPHVMLIGASADAKAKQWGLELKPPEYFHTDERAKQLEAALKAGRFELDHGGAEKDVYGTVGAVACDKDGNVAAATSTGGMVNKMPGRVGDSPIIGAGTYADNRVGALSGTGYGEGIMRRVAAARIAHWVEMGGLNLAEATSKILHEEAVCTGGFIGVTSTGEMVMDFNTAGMFRAMVGESHPATIAIW